MLGRTRQVARFSVVGTRFVRKGTIRIIGKSYRVALALLLGGLFQTQADVLYTVTDLGGSFNVGTGINDAGQVVGGSVLYSNGQRINLGFSANAINNAGQVVGVGNNGHAVLYSNGQITDLGTVAGSVSSSASSINDRGQVTGTATTAQGVQHAFLYSNGQMLDLGTLPGQSSSRATGINNAAQIVGNSGSSAFLYSNGQMSDLGPISAAAINNAGQVVGGGPTDMPFSTATARSRTWVL